jgi:hypothetical protein
MAQAPQSPGGNDNFIRRIVTDPKNVPDVMLLTGYLGASSEEAHERLYLSPDLTNYVEIPNTAILHQAPLPKEQDAHGGVTLWVRKDAALQYKMAPAAQALANYFAGAIQAAAQGAPGGAGAAAGPRATIGVHCATFNCSLHCATEITPCINTHANTCFCPVTHACPSQNQFCQSQGACTYVGCGASLACTQGLLCGGVAAAAQAGPGTTFGACGAPVGVQARLGGTTEVTPCLNTHAVACNHPLTALCPTNACQSPNVCTLGNQPGCQSAGCQSFAKICEDPQAALAGQANLQPSFVPCSVVCTPPGPPPANTPFCFTNVACLTPHPPCVVQATGNAPGCVTRFWLHCTQPPNCVVSGLGTCLVNGCTLFVGVCRPFDQSPFAQPCAHAAAFAGQPGFGGAAAFARNVGNTLAMNCSPAPWCYHTQWDICM